MSSQTEPQFIDAQTLLVEARYRDRTLCAHVLAAGASRGFTVGAGRAADAPIDLDFLPPRPAANDNHLLVEPTGAGFLLNLTDAMRARAAVTAGSLRVPCGEVIFDISVAASPPPVPRPWLSGRWRRDARYLAGVAAALVLLIGLVNTVPADPRAISLDDIGRTIRLDGFHISPPVAVPPPPVPHGGGVEGGGAAPSAAAAGPAGAAGSPKAPRIASRPSSKGPATRQDARDVERDIVSHSVLSVLLGQRSKTFTQILGDPALGDSPEDVLGNLKGPEISTGYGLGGLTSSGTGAHGGGTGRPMLGGSTGLETIPGGPGGRGPGRGYGHTAGTLGPRRIRQVEVSITDPVTRGSLDKEIVRRVVRQHLNEVRYCYEQALVRAPSLAGRVVVQFTIAPTGRVLVSALQSSTLAAPQVGSCIVEATRRWEYPRPDGGGLVSVTYPFQLAPAGG